MKKFSILLIILAGTCLFSCQKKAPEFIRSVPDDAFAVVTLHPMQIHKKGQMNTLENLKSKIKKEYLKQILEDPLSSGLDLNQYACVFVTMEKESPEIGAIAGMGNMEKFETMLDSADKELTAKIVEKNGFKMVTPDEEGVIGWNKKQVILLISPKEEKSAEAWSATLDSLFNLPKEESITSMVDFNSFTKNMKDLNAWVSSDRMRELLENLNTDTKINLPFSLYNNYAHLFCEFNDGAVNISGKTNFSEEVSKNVEEFLVMKNSLNKEMLNLAPGGDLLMAFAASMDLEKMQKVIGDMVPMDSLDVSDRIEQVTGIPGEKLLEALTGDFVMAINGIEGESMIPVELFIGAGVKNEVVQDLLMDKLEGMTQVDQQGDFFVINVQGIQIYSGIVNGIWVLTNKAGYKDAVQGGGLPDALPDSRFKDFSNRSLGIYLNLDLQAYPSMITQQFTGNPKQKAFFDYISESFSYFGTSGGNYESEMILKTKKPGENSLYTLMKITELPE
ncbi:MAG: DUF4836 family protein [Bacteroidales bacterium]|nr:DUF4836 family protein [Bacteroidales bacterium]